MKTSEFSVELRKKEEKYNVTEKSCGMLQIREGVGRSQQFFKIGVLKSSYEFHKKSPVIESLFNNVAGLKRSAILLKRDSSKSVFL